jgi:phosphohistidine phosphatase
MRLYVMRHGPAEDNAATGRDEDRALTRKGRERVQEVAQLLVREREVPARLLASRLVRAQQTADIVGAVARAGGWNGETETVPELAPGGRTIDLVRGLAKSSTNAPMVVGHEPDLTALVERLLIDAMPCPMDKGMVVALELDLAGPARLRFIVDPRAVAVVHDARG